MSLADKAEIKALFKYPLMEAIARRRTRRFPAGCVSPEGALQHSSTQPAVPLNDLETAMLCWSGAGITGTISGDLATRHGGSTFGSWVGRAVPQPCNVHNTKLFFTNDRGTFLYDPKKATKYVEIETESDRDRILTYYQKDCVKLSDERVEFTSEGLGRAMHWNVNRPGTTVFMPVVDQSEEYINYVLGIFDYEGYGYRMFDDLKDQSAGLQSWIDAGKLKGPQRTMSSTEQWVFMMNLAPAYLMLENMHLVAEAMGMGALMFGGYTGQIMLGITSKSKGLGFRSSPGKDGKANAVGLDGIFEGYCPPYYQDMGAAVDAFLLKKNGPGGPYSESGGGITPFKHWDEVGCDYRRPSELSMAQVKSYFNYVYDTYGKIPATADTMVLPCWLQVHHVDVDFYERHIAGDLSKTHREHMGLWHPEDSARA